MSFPCLIPALFIFFLAESRASDLRIANRSTLTCSQELPCTVTTNNCIYDGWLRPSEFVPSSPDHLKVEVRVIQDENGEWVPAITAQWQAKDDGSIIFLNGTEVQIMKVSGGPLCIHYYFLKRFPSMKNPNGQLWSFSLDNIVVSPEEEYVVSVANLPKPNVDQKGYDISTRVRVPGCQDPVMRQVNSCIERGEFWQPNITTVKSGQDGSQLAVSFKTGENSEKYNVIVKCKGTRHFELIKKENRSALNVTFSLEKWPSTCCSFVVEIQPFFDMCKNDCLRKKDSFTLCSELQIQPKPAQGPPLLILVVGLFILISGICVICFICYHKRLPKITSSTQPPEESAPLSTERSVWIIYSRDHPKYTDIVLKLCAFLRAKCGTDVYLDLLDMSCIGAMGRLPWTEWQKRRIEMSSDKILVLCSRGMQAKWGAMCGAPPVHLREDVSSPVGDMLTLALQLITPDMQRPAAFGKYLVAYFEDVCDEGDVPSIFNVAVKYQLMKDFEKLFFRILELEKYQRGRVHTIEGIGADEYFNCPSGKALRDAVEVFQNYQVQHPDWFANECLDNEDEALPAENKPFLDASAKIYKCEPLFNEGLPVHECEVEIHTVDQAVGVQTVEISEFIEPSVHVIHPAPNQIYSLYPALQLPPCISTSVECPPLSDSMPCISHEPSLQDSSPSYPSESFTNNRSPADGCSIDDLENLRKLQASLISFEMFAPPPSLADHNQTPRDFQSHPSHPIEMDENEAADVSGTKQSRWSDQGYSSRDSSPHHPLPSPLAGFNKLQEAVCPFSSGFQTQTMES